MVDTGTTYDLSAFAGQQAVGDARLTQQIATGDSPGAAITGVLKVAQWFVVEFLTIRGTMPYDPTRGTRFVADFISGRLRNETDAFLAFSFAVGDIIATAALVEDPGAPADERLDNATLQTVAISGTTLLLKVSIQTRAGTSRQITLPVSAIN